MTTTTDRRLALVSSAATTSSSRAAGPRVTRRRRKPASLDSLVPFGKYKGQPLADLIADTQYCDWLLDVDWFQADNWTGMRAVIEAAADAAEQAEEAAAGPKPATPHEAWARLTEAQRDLLRACAPDLAALLTPTLFDDHQENR